MFPKNIYLSPDRSHNATPPISPNSEKPGWVAPLSRGLKTSIERNEGPDSFAEANPSRSNMRAEPARNERKRLSLALQGGGAFGAFTWGVLDRLLEEESVDFDAVLFASGLARGG